MAYPLYNRTYMLYRVSPLHHADVPLLQERSLRLHAKRLREQLKGDSVRGVEVDFQGTEVALPNLGPLDVCDWDLIGDEDAWVERRMVDPESSQLQLSPNLSADQARGIEVKLEYETMAYNALLLRDPSATTSPEGFTSLPLLLVKMPTPVRDIFLNYLRTSFDAHVVPLRLPSAFLTSSLETYFRHLSSDSSTQSIQNVIRQLQVQLAFPNATTLLKHLDVTIAGRDVPGFVSRGKALKKTEDKPFTAALSAYIKQHLALDMSHPKVQIARIQCGSFLLSTDRLKLVAPEYSSNDSTDGSSMLEPGADQQAVQEFYTSLIREATGTGRFLPEDLIVDTRASTPSSTTSHSRDRRKRAVSNAATGNAAAKRSKARVERGRDAEMVDS